MIFTVSSSTEWPESSDHASFIILTTALYTLKANRLSESLLRNSESYVT